MKNFYFCSVVASFSVFPAAFGESSCTGWDSQTDAFVTGNCNGGMFSGWDSQTGAYVSGTCTDGGSFSAWDEQSDAWVNGTCE